MYKKKKNKQTVVQYAVVLKAFEHMEDALLSGNSLSGLNEKFSKGTQWRLLKYYQPRRWTYVKKPITIMYFAHEF